MTSNEAGIKNMHAVTLKVKKVYQMPDTKRMYLY